MQWTNSSARRIAAAAALAGLLLLASCGGGGGNPGTCFGSEAVCNPGSTSPGSNTGSSGNASAFLAPEIPSSTVAGICAPATQKQFVRSYLNEAYLWASEVPQVNSTLYSPEDYFYSLRVTTPDVHGLPKDRFSFVVSNADADSMSSGAAFEYGVEWSRDAQDRFRVARIVPGSSAERAGMARGGELVSVVSSSHSTWYPNTSGATVTLIYRAGTAADRTITLTATAVQDDPVPLSTTVLSTMGRRVGYVLFHNHSAGAQDKLIPAVRALAADGIQDLVLDLRYNTGGYLYTATTLASMVTGPASDGRIFERLEFNSRRTAADPDNTVWFSGQVQYGEAAYRTGAALPRLSLKRVYVLTTESTCSASEAVVNGLRGVDVEVILVGSTTCGKPYGFTRQDNCGLSLFPIEFQGFNDKNYGDYSTGFSATCPVADDFNHTLGDPAEGLLGVALRHADQGVCTPSTALARTKTAGSTAAAPAGPVLELRPTRAGRVLPPHNTR